MAELITQRIRRNAAELRLHAIADSPDELIERAETAQLGYREFLDLLLESEVGVLEGRRYSPRTRPIQISYFSLGDKNRLLRRPRPPAPLDC